MRLLPLALLLLLFSCKKDEDPAPDYRPVVALHGFLASGDTWASHFKAFAARGYAQDRLFAFDYNTLASDEEQVLSDLDAFIDEVLAQTGWDQVDLMGHSRGGGVSYDYLADPARAAKVAHYAHIGSFGVDSAAGPGSSVPTLNIWSPDDRVVSSGDIPGAVNVAIPGADHYEVATHPDGFTALWKHFNEVESVPDPGPGQGDAVRIGGKALTFGENSPVAGGTVEIWGLDEQAQRLSAAPALSLTVAADGSWGPADMPDAPFLEFRITASSGGRPINYFREASSASDLWIYLRTIPPPFSLAGILLAALPQDDDQTVIAVFSSSQAVIAGRDNLMVDGFELSQPVFASADQTSIAFFLFDDGDQSSSGELNSTFAALPFLNGVDLFFPTSSPGVINLELNGRSLPVRNLRSNTDGPVVAVFE